MNSVALATLLQTGVPQGLSTGGLIMLIGSVTIVCGLCAFCTYRILTEAQPSEHHHAPLDINTHDL